VLEDWVKLPALVLQGFVVVFIVAIMAFYFNAEIQDNDTVSETAKNVISSITTKWLAALDYVIAIAYLGMALFIFYSSILVPSSWKFYLIAIVHFAGGVLVVPAISELAISLMTANAYTQAVAETTPITYWIFSNLLMIQVAVFFIAAILFYGKNKEGSINEETAI